MDDHIFKANESALNIVPTIEQYGLKTEILRIDATMYPMKKVVDGVVTRRFK
ncbi:hypothetical protein HET73_06260 [Wolbachia endosymbiont of Atemnus politus]|uniref:hypothetical protein n=1 Tax=Wolbachia endosymbiont of Atemnus politus TaxID=2682840 RepID=UPI001574E626|nr:hypothetical protein [Wolbachia endosymbiont of Atemnus politus]